MDIWVAIDFRGRRLENFCPQTLRKPQHVDGAVDARLCRLHWIVLVVNGRSRAGEVIDLIDFDVERERHIVTNQLKAMVIEQMIDVASRAGEEVIDAYDDSAIR